MEYRDNNSRFQKYNQWENTKYLPYNYSKYGLLQHILSRKITDSYNPILQSVLGFFERSLIFLMKYVDELKHFKNYHWKNR